MHELGIVINIVKIVEDFAIDHNLTKIASLTLQVGELSSAIPHYIQECYPAAVDGTLLQNTKLNVEIITANAVCQGCGKVFGVMKNRNLCPHCGCTKYEIVSGRELYIKEIEAC